MFLIHELNKRRNHNIQIHSKSSERVTKFNTIQNSVHDETDSSSNSGNTCHTSAQNLISSCVLSKNINIKIYKNI